MTPNEPPRIELTPGDDDRGRPRGRTSPIRKSSKSIWKIAAVVAVLGVVLSGGWLISRLLSGDADSSADGGASDNSRQSVGADPKQLPQTAPQETTPDDNQQPAAETVVDDDGRLLWASPTDGPPVSLAYVPSAARVLMYVRTAQLTAHRDGQQVLAALGPWGASGVRELERLSLCQLDEIDALLVAVLADAAGEIRFVLRVELLQPWDDDQLRQRGAGDSTQRLDDQMIWVDGGMARMLPEELGGRTLVVGPRPVVEELIEQQADEPSLPRDLQAVLRSTDAQRTITLALDPRFLQASGSKLLQGASSSLRDALSSVLGRDASAVTLSANWGDHFFFEIRVVPHVSTPTHRYASQLRSRIDRSSEWIEAVVRQSPTEMYGRRLVVRLPQMTEQASALFRCGVDDGQAAARTVLPSPAGANLLAGTELLLTQPAAPASASLADRSLADPLARVTSLQVRGESLEGALQMLSDDLGVPIEILGQDLQLEGITRNQTLSLDLRDQTGAEILTAIVRRANPDPSVASPSDPRQKLVYLVRRGQEERSPGQPAMRIIVTTRAEAARRGDKLPQVFVESDR